MKAQQLRLNIVSDPANLAETRRSVEAFASSHGFDQRACDEIGLCVNEALANVIRHAYQGVHDKPIEIVATAATDSLRIAIRDWGTGTDPQRLPPRRYDPLEPGGLGMICLKQMMQSIEYAPQPDGGVKLEMTRTK